MRMIIKLALVSAFTFTTGCANDVADPDIDLYPQDRGELADESVPDEVDSEDIPGELAICHPDLIHGRVTDLSVDGAGRVRARGTVFSEAGPCHVSVNVRLTRNGNRIDSQQKDCASESCTSRRLSAGNPAGRQEFCAVVRQSATGGVMDKKCITR